MNYLRNILYRDNQLQKAIEDNNTIQVLNLLNNGVNPNGIHFFALDEAVKNNYVEIAHLLLENKADPNIKIYLQEYNNEGDIVLSHNYEHVLQHAQSVEMINLLHEYGARAELPKLPDSWKDAIILKDDMCGICHDDLNENIIMHQCGNQYHKQCIQNWYLHSKKCPMCGSAFGKKINRYKN